MAISTIEWRKGKVRLIDQTKLPAKLVYLELGNLKQLWWAIRRLKVRGAPALGIAAGFALVLGMRNSKANSYRQFSKQLQKVIGYLKTARPTAVNLFWALERMEQKVALYPGADISFLKRLLLKEALAIAREDKDICRRLAGFGARLIKDKDSILTHCNAGGLATSGYGTALGVIYHACAQGKRIKVYADETRPVLQGARLTAWELMRHKIDVTLICDSMAAQLMRAKRIDQVLVGADRIAANGDTANKIGTYNLAALANFHKIPFYIAAPISSFDFRIKSGKQIPIEQRDPREITELFGRRIAPKDVQVYNPAFDVTPHRLISAIITEDGILRKPDRLNLQKLIKRNNDKNTEQWCFEL